MQILKTQRYLDELEEILDFIAQDSLNRALRFFDELNEKILLLPQSPYKPEFDRVPYSQFYEVFHRRRQIFAGLTG